MHMAMMCHPSVADFHLQQGLACSALDLNISNLTLRTNGKQTEFFYIYLQPSGRPASLPRFYKVDHPPRLRFARSPAFFLPLFRKSHRPS